MEENKPDEIASGKKETSSNETEHMPTKEEYNEDLKKRTEDKYKGSLIQAEYLLQDHKNLYGWLEGITRFKNIDRTMLIFKTEEWIRIRFFTANNVYHISVKKHDDAGGYMGCTSSLRKELVGEFWTRGSDLPDGDYTKETFDKIVRAIVRQEMKNLQLWR